MEVRHVSGSVAVDGLTEAGYCFYLWLGCNIVVLPAERWMLEFAGGYLDTT